MGSWSGSVDLGWESVLAGDFGGGLAGLGWLGSAPCAFLSWPYKSKLARAIITSVTGFQA